jgi:molecular chaperone DnaK (HSP70)
MSLDLDGILHVTAVEKCTGKSKHITITRALDVKSEAEIEAARKRLDDLFAGEEKDGESWSDTEDAAEDQEIDAIEEIDEIDGEESAGAVAAGELISADQSWDDAVRDGRQLVERSRRLLTQMHDDDREEVIGLNERIEAAIAGQAVTVLGEANDALRELLFFVEGKE